MGPGLHGDVGTPGCRRGAPGGGGGGPWQRPHSGRPPPHSRLGPGPRGAPPCRPGRGGYVSPVRMGRGAGTGRARKFPESRGASPLPPARRPPPARVVGSGPCVPAREPRGAPTCARPVTWAARRPLPRRSRRRAPPPARRRRGRRAGAGTRRLTSTCGRRPARPGAPLPWRPERRSDAPRGPRTRRTARKSTEPGRDSGRPARCPFKPVPARGPAWPVGGPC